MNQISFPAFAASRTALLCPPAGALQTANDVPALVAQPDASGQRVGTHAKRREARVIACMRALVSRSDHVKSRFVLVQNASWGPVAISFLTRPEGRLNEFSCCPESLHRVRGAV